MADDPYEILGMKRDASQKEMQQAYRKLAKKLHPDLNPGDKEAERKFKELNAAYDIVGDADKRARFDRGEIDATGNERPPQQERRYYRDYAGAGGPAGQYHSASGFADFSDDDVLSEFFARRGGGEQFRMRGQDLRYAMEVDFLDAANGTSRQVTFPDGKAIDIKIPPGTRDGQTLRLRGKGEPGTGGEAAGDALIDITVRPHPLFDRDGDNIRLELPVSLREAVLGGKVKVPTLTGSVMASLPAWSNSGKTLRLKGKGVGGRGDIFVTLKIVLPDREDAALKTFVEGWQAGEDQHARDSAGR